MARRVIATAEVQVAADVGKAEAGLEGLTESFRQIGSIAERAAERAEVAFFNGARGMAQGLQNVEREVFDLITSMGRVSDEGAEMSRAFWGVYASIRRSAEAGASLEDQASQWLNLFRQTAATTEAVERGLFDVEARAKAVADAAREAARQTQEIENATLEAERRAYRLSQAFRDVGQDIDLALAGGMDELQDEIVRTIRRLADMGDKGFDVARILERSFDGVLDQFENDVEGATAALFRLRQAGDSALDTLDNDARKAESALNQVAVAANRADRSIDTMGGVMRRTSGDVRGLVGLLGAAGLGYAAFSAAKAGLDMTRQLEKSEAMFLGLTGSVEGAADMLERMVMFARETPYNLASVSEAAAQLLAIGDDFGVTTANVEQYLTTFGDAITMTGGSEDQFIRIVRVLGQMSSTGKVLGQDMNQLAQNLPGYDVWQQLADGAGTSVTELRRLQDLGQLDNLLTGNQAVEILIEGMQGIPGAAGAMERRMNTLGGAIEKFTETAEFAMVQGLQPFSEELQDTLSDPGILRSVEDVSEAFGSLLSTALEDVRPEIDDLAAAGENFLKSWESWTPVLTQIADALGDVLNVASAIISPLGKLLSVVLNLEGGLGKMALAMGAFAVGGPFGIAAGVALGVSGAMDALGSSSEEAARLTSLFAAAQGEANLAMSAGEEVAYSEAQQLAIDMATELQELYPDLVAKMGEYGIGLTELQTGLAAMADGTGQVTPKMQEFFASYAGADGHAEALLKLVGTYKNSTEEIAEDVATTQDVLAIAEVDQIGSQEAMIASLQAMTEQETANWEYIADARQEAADAAAETNDEWGELDEERTDKLRDLLQEQADAYSDWAADIDGTVEGAGESMSDFADEFEGDVRKMIDAQNKQNVAIAGWKSNIVTAASTLVSEFGVSEEAAQQFMGTLGDIGPEFAPGIASMIDGSEEGKAALLDFFNSTGIAAAVNATSLTEEFDRVTGAVPTLAEELAEGTLTIDDILAELPAAMEAAGIDMETAAGMIDVSDEMGVVGSEAVDGLINALGSPSALARARGAGSRLANQVVAGSSGTLRVSSPSKVFYDIGEFVVEGLVDGIQSMDDEAYASAVQIASMLTGGIADHFKDADDPQEEARKFAKDIADAIIEELIAEQEAVADAAEALAEAAADRLDEAWDRVKDRFKKRDLKESVNSAVAELTAAQAELAAAESLAGAGGASALAAARPRVVQAQRALDEAERLLAEAKELDEASDMWADEMLIALRRRNEDAARALTNSQEDEIDAIKGRIAAANRNLDPAARAAAEEELELALERHEAEQIALDRQLEDEERFERQRLANENEVRELQIKSIEDQVSLREDELEAFEDALQDIVDSIADAVASLPGLRADVSDARSDVQDSFFDQFEDMLENVDNVSVSLLRATGLKAGLSRSEVDDLIKSAQGASAARTAADATSLGMGQLIDVLGSGLYTIGADGALGIAAGLSDTSYAIAQAMWASVQTAIDSTLASLEIRSPSRVTERMIGQPMAEGIARGLLSGEGTVSSAMTGLLNNVVGGARIPSSQLVDSINGGSQTMSTYRGPLVTMPNAVIQDATDADLVAQRVVVALAATGVQV